MELYIIRHGQSTNNVSMMSDPLVREVDPPLTTLGQKQAEAVAHFLANAYDRDRIIDTSYASASDQGNGVYYGVKIGRLLVSPMRRALQTARPVAAALGLKAEVWTDIFEHGGMYLEDRQTGAITGYGGLTRAGLLAEFPDYVLPETVTESGWWDASQGKETRAACFQRALMIAQHLRDMASTEESVALVTHGTFSGILLKALLNNTTPDDSVRLSHYNTGVSRLDFNTESLWLRYLNRIDHLSPELVSA